jgi:hypothetical protein
VGRPKKPEGPRPDAHEHLRALHHELELAIIELTQPGEAQDRARALVREAATWADTAIGEV